MKSIRIGNDINIKWTIERLGSPEPLSLHDLRLTMANGYDTWEVSNFELDGNVLSFTFPGKDQHKPGTYTLTLTGNAGDEGMFTFDACEVFRLVSTSCQAGGADTCANLSVESVEVSSDIEVPANGLSAYQVWLSNGHQGTEEDFLTWLQQPAQSAADEADKATEAANTEWYAVNTAAQAKQIAFATTETAQVMMLAMRTLPEPQTLDGELLAPAGYYLTQAEETPIENRLFLTRKVILPDEDVSKWRVATSAEKQEQDEYFEQQLPS